MVGAPVHRIGRSGRRREMRLKERLASMPPDKRARMARVVSSRATTFARRDSRVPRRRGTLAG
jgi:hypothetical protein